MKVSMIKSAAYIKDGVLYTGKTHADIIHRYYSVAGKFLSKDEDGFCNGFW